MSNISQQQLNVLIAALANGKMIQELDNAGALVSSVTVAINDGTSSAKKATLDKLRGLKGSWNASTNSPALVNGSGAFLDSFLVSHAGTVNFGNGPITFAAGDLVVYNSTQWFKISRDSNASGSIAKQEFTYTAPNNVFVLSSPAASIIDVQIGNGCNFDSYATLEAGTDVTIATEGILYGGEKIKIIYKQL